MFEEEPINKNEAFDFFDGGAEESKEGVIPNLFAKLSNPNKSNPFVVPQAQVRGNNPPPKKIVDNKPPIKPLQTIGNVKPLPVKKVNPPSKNTNQIKEPDSIDFGNSENIFETFSNLNPSSQGKSNNFFD